MRAVSLALLVYTVACRTGPPPAADSAADSGAPVDCPTATQARAWVMDASDAMPGETAVGTAGDFMLANDQAAFVITEPDKGSTYYHYGGIVADAVARDGCEFAGQDKLDEVGLVLVHADLADFDTAVVRAFRGDSAEILADGSDGGPAIVRVTGVDDYYWLVEYELIKAAASSGGRGLSDPYGVDVVVDYVLEPDSPVLHINVSITNQGTEDPELAVATLLSVGGTMDVYSYAPYGLTVFGYSFNYGLPWLVSTDGDDALAYAIDQGNMAYMGVAGVRVAIDADQFLGDAMVLPPGGTDTRSMLLSVGAGAGTTATQPLAAVNPEPVPGQPYTLATVSGRVLDPTGAPVGDASIEIQALSNASDWGTLDLGRSDGDGSFSLPIPDFGDDWSWRLRATAAGRHDSDEVFVAPGDGDVELVVSARGSLDYRITDDQGDASAARLHLVGSDGDSTDQWLAGEGNTPLAPDTYSFTATRGYEYAPVTGTLTIPDDGVASIDLEMDRVVDTTGWVSVDTHVHSSDSPDSRTAPVDVLLHAAAHGLDVVVHTEHENIVDRAELPVDAGLADLVTSITGEEVTASIPEHLTMFPAEADGSPRGGTIEWYSRDIDELFEMMRQRSHDGVNLLNHPGYLDTIAWDRLVAEPALDDPTVLGLAPDAELWSWNLDGLEVMNGHGVPFASGNRRWDNWQSMLNAGHALVAVGCSDDHSGDQVGFPRSYVAAGSDHPADITDQEVVDAFQAGQVIVSAGAFARVSLDGVDVGALVTDTDGNAELSVHIEALPEIDVDFVSVFVNCDELLTVPASDPGGVVKLDETLSVQLPDDGDAQVTVAAFGEDRLPPGLPQFDAAGVPRVLVNPIYVDTDGDGLFSAPGGRECAVWLTGP